MDIKYGWKQDRFGVSAQVAAEELERIKEKHKTLEPQTVVDESTPEDAPLHSCFEWNDDIAANAYRVEQAKYIIRNIVIREVNGGPPPVMDLRGYISTKTENDDKPKFAYMRVDEVMQDTNLRKQVLNQAMRDLEAFKKKYGHLVEFSKIIKEINKIKL